MTEQNIDINPEPKIWILVDNRDGNANQALALAEELEVKYKIIKLDYNNFAKLPSLLLGIWPMHLKKPILNSFKNQTIPDLVIASGRRTASVALYLKKLSQGKSKIIQIMRPGSYPKEFDLIILPQHDNFNQILPNVVRIIGALTGVHKKLAKASEALSVNYPNLQKFIAVMIGGGNKKWNFTLDDATSFAESLTNISANHLTPLFISFSRRTPDHVKELFRNRFYWPNVIYDPNDAVPNPYPGMIGCADYIITTADSISMCSEAASTGKPLYIFCPENFHLKKHRFFIQQLVDLEIARRLDSNTTQLEAYQYEPLREIGKVAKIIKEKFL